MEKDQISAAVKFCKAKQIENFKNQVDCKKTAKTEINLEKAAEMYFGIQWAMHIVSE